MPSACCGFTSTGLTFPEFSRSVKSAFSRVYFVLVKIIQIRNDNWLFRFVCIRGEICFPLARIAHVENYFLRSANYTKLGGVYDEKKLIAKYVCRISCTKPKYNIMRRKIYQNADNTQANTLKIIIYSSKENQFISLTTCDDL